MFPPALVGMLRRPNAIRRVLVICATLIALTGGPPSVAGQDDAGQGSAVGRAQVVAQGVATLPSGEAVWRTVRTRAEAIDSAEFEPRPLGFVLATSGSMLLTDRNTGEQLLLGQGEAAFVRNGTVQRRASLTGQPVTYLAIELVASDAAPPPDDAIVLQPGQPFPAPAGSRDLDLLSGTLLGGETLLLPDTGAKNVILITDGAVNAGRAGGEPVVLLAGEAATFSGELQISPAPGGAEPFAAFVMATIGQEVPPPPAAPTPAPEQNSNSPLATPSSGISEPGSLSLQVFTCPPGMDGATLAAAACGPAASGFDVTIVSEQLATPLTIADADVAEEAYTWRRLPTGEYGIALTVLPPGAASYALSARNASGDAESGYTVTLDAENRDQSLRIYVFFPG